MTPVDEPDRADESVPGRPAGDGTALRLDQDEPSGDDRTAAVPPAVTALPVGLRYAPEGLGLRYALERPVGLLRPRVGALRVTAGALRVTDGALRWKPDELRLRLWLWPKLGALRLKLGELRLNGPDDRDPAWLLPPPNCDPPEDRLLAEERPPPDELPPPPFPPPRSAKAGEQISTATITPAMPDTMRRFMIQLLNRTSGLRGPV